MKPSSLSDIQPSFSRGGLDASDMDMVPVDLDIEALKAINSVSSPLSDSTNHRVDSTNINHHTKAPNIAQATKAATSTVLVYQPTSSMPPISDDHLIEKPTIAATLPAQKKQAWFEQPQNNWRQEPPSPPTLIGKKVASRQSTKPSVVMPYDNDEPLTLSKRLMDMVSVGFIFAFIGIVIDWVINIIKSFSAIASGDMVWLFVYIMGGLGLILGGLMGTKALDVVFGLFRRSSHDTSLVNDDDGFSSGIMKAIGFGLILGIVGWLLMMMFA